MRSKYNIILGMIILFNKLKVNLLLIFKVFCLIYSNEPKRQSMKSLSETWFAEGYIDFELKKYTLLAYLKEVNKYFNESNEEMLHEDLRFDRLGVYIQPYRWLQ